MSTPLPNELDETGQTAAKEAKEKVWELAIQIYNRDFTHKHSIRLDKSTSQPVDFPFCSIDDLLASANRVSRERYGDHNRSGCRRKATSALKDIRTYAPIFDVFTQGQPGAVSICWGMMRLVIEAAGRGLQSSEHLLITIAGILRQLNTFEVQLQYLDACPKSLDSIACLHASLIDFLYRASRYCAGSRWRRFCCSIRGKLDLSTTTIDRLTNEVHRQVTTHSATSVPQIVETHQVAWNEARDYRASDAAARKQDHQELQAAFQMAETQLKSVDQATRGGLGKMQQALVHSSNTQSIARRVAAWVDEDLVQSESFPRAASETCSWIADHEDFQKWTRHGRGSPLWVYGKSGSGKTTLCWSMHDSISEDCNEDCNAIQITIPPPRRTRHSVASQAILSIVSQLLHHHASSRSKQFAKILDRFDRNCAMTARPAASLCIRELKRLSSALIALLPSLTLLVDDVHLLKPDSDHLKGQVTQKASEVLSYLSDLASQPAISVILFSRHRRWLNDSLSSQLQITKEVTDTDIVKVAHCRIHQNPLLRPLSAEIITKFQVNADGDFVWASLLLEALEKTRTSSDVKACLSQSSKTTHNMYRQLSISKEQSLSAIDRERRRKLLSIAAAATQALTVSVLANALAFDLSTNAVVDDELLFDAPRSIVDLCDPFLEIDEDLVHFRHESAHEYVLTNIVDIKDANEFLFKLCLAKLSEATYMSRQYCERKLMDNLLSDSLTSSPHELSDSGLYRHAALHIQDYALELRLLSNELRRKLKIFLFGNAFVSWSENVFIFRNRNGLDTQLNVGVSLSSWYERLDHGDDVDETDIDFDQYFLQPYTLLSEQLRRESDVPVMQFVALVRPGQFLNLGGKTPTDYAKAYSFKQRVAEGYLQYLGPNNRRTLLARRAFYQEFHWLQRFDEALAGYQDILSIQKERYADTIDIYDTIEWIGIAFRALARFKESRLALEEAAKGYRDLLGPESKPYLLVQMFLAFTVEAEGSLSDAASLYSDVYSKWIPVGGKSSPFSHNLLTAYGSLLRKQGQFDTAEDHLISAFGSRVRTYTISSQVTVDSGLHLGALYRQMQKRDEATKFLEQVEPSSMFQISYERACQLAHIKALLAFDAGEYDSPRNTLMALVMQSTGSDRYRNNRELLLVRLNLADALRAHEEEDLALMLFAELVTSTEKASASQSSFETADLSGMSHPSLEVKVDTLNELDTAERALRLIRDARFDEAADLLSEKKLRWVREKDFWVISGGPKVDTESVRYALPTEIDSADAKAYTAATQSRPPKLRVTKQHTLLEADMYLQTTRPHEH